MNIQKELMDWADKTVNVYNPLAQTKKLGYYTQSVLNRETLDPDLLILGINPGAAGGGIMSGEELLQGNPCFKGKGDEEIKKIYFNDYDSQKRKRGWDIVVKIRKMLELAGKQILNDLDKFVLSNMVFLGTSKQGQIPLSFNEQMECATQTIKLIDILKPKVVLLLGDQTRDLFMKVANISRMEELIPNYHGFYCFFKNVHVISIYHTAYYSYYNFDNMAIIGNILGYALDNSKDIIDKNILEKDLYERTIIRSIKIKNLLNRKDAIPLIDKNKALSYDLWQTIKNGNYVKSKDNIVIALTPEEDKKQYTLLVYTRQNNEEKNIKLINGIWPNEEFNPWECDKSRHVHEIISFDVSNEEIKNKMEKVLDEVKAYRDKEYPLK
jgi:hypothetical protein